jgi:hypothetical protein
MPIAVFHQGSAGDFGLWCSQYDYDGETWSQDTRVEPPGGLDLWLSPGPVVGFGGVTVFHQGWNSDVGADGVIWSTYSPDGVNWGRDTPLQGYAGGISYGSAIAPVVYTGNGNLNGNLYLFYQVGVPTGDPEGPPGIDLPPPGASVRRRPPGARVRQNDALSGQLMYLRYDGTQWNGPYPISNVGSVGAVGSAVNWMGGITVFYQGVDSNYNPDGSLWYAYSTDGVNWGGGTPVPIAGLSCSPSAFVYGNHLCVFYQGPGYNGQLFYSVFDGTNWEFDNLVTTLQLSFSPSAMQYGDGIAVFHQGGGDDQTLRWVYSSDGSPGNWTGDMLVQNVGMTNSPSALWIPYTAPPPA